MALDTDTSGRLLSRLALLEAFDLPLVYVGSDLNVEHLSGRAAYLLEISDRSELSSHAHLFSPLVELARSVGPRAQKQIQAMKLMSGAAAPSRNFREMVLDTTSGQKRHVLANAVPLDPQIAGAAPGTVILMHELRVYEPLLRTAEVHRRSRISTIVAYGALADQYGLPAVASLLQGIMEPRELRNEPSLAESTDLLSGLTIALEAVDPLIVSSAKVVLRCGTSALIAATPGKFLRLLCHLLLEATDYSGPFGQVRVTADLASSPESAPNARPHSHAKVLIEADRNLSVPAGSTALDLYLYQRLLPKDHRIVMPQSTEAAELTPSPPESRPSAEPSTGAERVGYKIPQRTDIPLSAESTSRQLRSARELALQLHGSISLAVAKSGQLLVTLFLPLHGV